MADLLQVQMGQINSAGATDALFRDMLSSDAIVAFNNATEFKNRTTTRVFTNADKLTFYATGTLVAKTRTPGNRLVGQTFNQNKVTFAVDDLLHVTNYVDNYDELKHPNSSQVRAEMGVQAGVSLANVFDLKAYLMLVQAARSGPVVTGQTGGETMELANIDTDAEAFRAVVMAARTSLAKANVNWKMNTSCGVSHDLYAVLASSKVLMNKDWTGSGNYGEGSIDMVAGIPLFAANTLTSADLTLDADVIAAGLDPEIIIAKYRGDFTYTRGIVFQEKAIGIGVLKGINTITHDMPDYVTTMVSTQVGVGMGVVQPACARELSLVVP